MSLIGLLGSNPTRGMLFFYSMYTIFFKKKVFRRFYFPKNIYLRHCGAIVDPTSEVCSTAMLILQIVDLENAILWHSRMVCQT